MLEAADTTCIDLATFDFEGFMNEFDILTDIDKLDEAINKTQRESPTHERKPKEVAAVIKSVTVRPKNGQKLRKLRSNTPTKLLIYDERFKVVSPNMSLTTTDLKLYAFPRFNKCDALLYFPSTMASFINSGDRLALSELLVSHLPNSCPIQVSSAINFNLLPSSFLEFTTLLSDVYPDIIMCMHFTRVVEDEIRSKLYFKVTSNKSIYESMMGQLQDTQFAQMFPPTRTEHLKVRFDVTSKPVEEQVALTRLMNADEDVVIYGQIDFRLVLHSTTKKVSALHLTTELTSFKRSGDAEDVDYIDK